MTYSMQSLIEQNSRVFVCWSQLLSFGGSNQLYWLSETDRGWLYCVKRQLCRKLSLSINWQMLIIFVFDINSYLFFCHEGISHDQSHSQARWEMMLNIQQYIISYTMTMLWQKTEFKYEQLMFVVLNPRLWLSIQCFLVFRFAYADQCWVLVQSFVLRCEILHIYFTLRIPHKSFWSHTPGFVIHIEIWAEGPS